MTAQPNGMKQRLTRVLIEPPAGIYMVVGRKNVDGRYFFCDTASGIAGAGSSTTRRLKKGGGGCDTSYGCAMGQRSRIVISKVS